MEWNGCSIDRKSPKITFQFEWLLKKKKEQFTIIEFEARLMFEDLSSRLFRNGRTVKESARKRYCFY